MARYFHKDESTELKGDLEKGEDVSDKPKDKRVKLYDLSRKNFSNFKARPVKAEPSILGGKKGGKQKNSETRDPFPGKAPIPEEKLQKHSRGEGTKEGKGVRTQIKIKQQAKREQQILFANEQAARSELLLLEESGFLEPDEHEFTGRITQKEIENAVDITSAAKHFDLKLEFGEYKIRYSRNGRHLLLGGRKGHVAALDWVTKDLMGEMNVMESVHDVCWLHNETMYAVAQKKWTYIYDNNGIELHCIKKLDNVTHMEFLPYHFLLATANDKSWLSWLDVSMGKLVNQFPTRLGRLDIMCQNPYNAVICLGHSKGTVTMWTPNTQEPVAKMLCHRQPIRAITVDPRGLYLATASVDSSLKIWDVRNFKCLSTYRVGVGASNLSFSQKGLLAISMGDVVEVYRDMTLKGNDGLDNERPRSKGYPYLRHRVSGLICDAQFCPYEDILGIGHRDGFSSMLVPGAGEPNFDALESNPFQNKTQRRETEVKALLEKIQPELISLDPSQLGEVDKPSLEETVEAKRKLLHVRAPKIDVVSKKDVGTAKKHHIKKQVQDERKREFIKTALKKKREVEEEEKEEGAEQPARKHPKQVLDRFKPKPKRKV